MIKMLKRFHKEESGQDLIEYALIALLIAVAATVAMGSVATGINTVFNQVATHLT